MKFSELDNRLASFKNALTSEFPNFIQLAVAKNAVALIRRRITTTGTDHRGKAFSPYSSRPTLAGGETFTSKGVADSFFNSEPDWVTIGEKRLAVVKGGYREIRQREGRQVAHKDFDRTTEMWKSIRPINRKVSNKKISIEIGSQVMLSNQKLKNLGKQEGVEILNLSDKEIKLLAQTIDRWLDKRLNNALS